MKRLTNYMLGLIYIFVFTFTAVAVGVAVLTGFAVYLLFKSFGGTKDYDDPYQ